MLQLYLKSIGFSVIECDFSNFRRQGSDYKCILERLPKMMFLNVIASYFIKIVRRFNHETNVVSVETNHFSELQQHQNLFVEYYWSDFDRREKWAEHFCKANFINLFIESVFFSKDEFESNWFLHDYLLKYLSEFSLSIIEFFMFSQVIWFFSIYYLLKKMKTNWQIS